MFVVQVREHDGWVQWYKFSTIGRAIHAYMKCVHSGLQSRIIYKDNQSVLHIPYVQNR